MKCGLSTRIALAMLRRFGHTPRTLLLVALPAERVHVVLHVGARGRGDDLPDHVEIARVLAPAARGAATTAGALPRHGLGHADRRHRDAARRRPRAARDRHAARGDRAELHVPRVGARGAARSSRCCWWPAGSSSSASSRSTSTSCGAADAIIDEKALAHGPHVACASARSALVMLATLVGLDRRRRGVRARRRSRSPAVVVIFVARAGHVARRRAVRELGRAPHVRRRHRARARR